MAGVIDTEYLNKDGSMRSAETAGQIVLAWVLGTSIVPIFPSIGLVLMGVSLSNTVNRGELAAVTIAVCISSVLIEFRLGRPGFWGSVLRGAQILLLVIAFFYYLLFQRAAEGEIVTKLSEGSVIATAALVVVATGLSIVTVTREFKEFNVRGSG